MVLFINTNDYSKICIDTYPEDTNTTEHLIASFVNANTALIIEFMKQYSDEGILDSKLKELLINLLSDSLDRAIDFFNNLNKTNQSE